MKTGETHMRSCANPPSPHSPPPLGVDAWRHLFNHLRASDGGSHHDRPIDMTGYVVRPGML